MTIHGSTQSEKIAVGAGAVYSEQAAAQHFGILHLAVVAAVLALAVLASGQSTPNVIQTVAGGGTITSNPTTADIPGPVAVLEDSKGNVYVAPPAADYIFELTSADEVIVFAGLGWGHYNKNPTGYNGPATQIPVYTSSGLGENRSGGIFIADTENNTIREVNSSGDIQTVAGRRQPCILTRWPYCNDGKQALDAYLYHPQGVVFDSSGNMYIADTGDNVVRWVHGGVINRLAGMYGETCRTPKSSCGDGGPGTLASLNSPMGISVDSQGNVYIADTLDNRIRCVAAVAGGCVSGSTPHYIYTVAGTGVACTTANDHKNSNPPYCGDGGPATQASIGSPHGVSVGASGEYYITETIVNRIRVASSGIISNFAGQPEVPGYSGDGHPATEATLRSPDGVYVDKAGNVFIADSGNQRIREVSVSTGDINTILGSANNGPAGSGGDGGAATAAMLAGPFQVAVDSSNNYYIADWANNRIRMVNVQTGVITTVAGNGDFGYSGDNGPATKATLEGPYGVAVDSSGNIYIADTGSGRIREVSGGTIYTVQGTKGPLVKPVTVAVDTHANLYIADDVAQVVFEESGGTVTVVAGTKGSACPAPTDPCGDGGPATEALLNGPTGVAIALNGDIFIADSNDNRVRCVVGVASTGCGGSGLQVGYIMTYAYDGKASFSGDGGPATQASRWFPKEVALDSGENLFIGGGQASVVQRIDYATSTIITVAGIASKQPNYFGYTGDSGPATEAELDNMGLAIDSNEDLLIADLNNNRVREVQSLIAVVNLTPSSVNFGSVPVGKKSQPQTVMLENVGANDLSISQITIGGNDPGDFNETNTCPAVPIPPQTKDQSSCKIKVTFTPKQQGERSAVLTITDNGFESPQQVQLTGTGTE